MFFLTLREALGSSDKKTGRMLALCLVLSLASNLVMALCLLLLLAHKP